MLRGPGTQSPDWAVWIGTDLDDVLACEHGIPAKARAVRLELPREVAPGLSATLTL